jgi:hypothetical protein
VAAFLSMSATMIPAIAEIKIRAGNV